MPVSPPPSAPAQQQRPQRADVPAPRGDPNSRLAHQQLLAKRTQGKIDVYFAGNSITRRWGATDYPEFLANWNANFGWGGDGAATKRSLRSREVSARSSISPAQGA
jgi:hypothetical protein